MQEIDHRPGARQRTEDGSERPRLLVHARHVGRRSASISEIDTRPTVRPLRVAEVAGTARHDGFRLELDQRRERKIVQRVRGSCGLQQSRDHPSPCRQIVYPTVAATSRVDKVGPPVEFGWCVEQIKPEPAGRCAESFAGASRIADRHIGDIDAYHVWCPFVPQGQPSRTEAHWRLIAGRHQARRSPRFSRSIRWTLLLPARMHLVVSSIHSVYRIAHSFHARRFSA